MSTPDEAAILVPAPRVFRVADKEIRVQPLPIRRLIGLVKYVEQNKDVLEKLGGILDVGVSAFLEQEIYKRLNEMLRMVVTPLDQHQFMTDDWCAEHLSNAHYRAILTTVLQQNELYEVFLQAKAYLGSHMGAALRQIPQLETAPKEPIATA